MIRSIFTGVAGMRNHQSRMDVISNNISNVNTTGFKYSRVNFADAVSQLTSPSTAPGGSVDRGGINVRQVGLGMQVASIDTIHTQGTISPTGKVTDIAIQGNGFFIMADGPQRFYTRNGTFDFDRNGNMVSPTSGLKVMGYQAVERKDSAGEAFYEIDQAVPIREIKVPQGSFIPPRRTTEVTFKGNLDQRLPVSAATPPAAGSFVETTVDVFDSLGNVHQVTFRFTHSTANGWTWEINQNAADKMSPPEYTDKQPLTFNANGTLAAPGGAATTPGAPYPAGTVKLEWELASGEKVNTVISPNFGKIGEGVGMTQFGNPTTAVAVDQNGFSRGDLTGIAIDKSGVVSGVYSNGRQRILAQMALATFSNPGGLQKEGDNNFIKTNNSGDAVVRAPTQAEAGSILSGALENSNVDLAEQFADMIITQRGFQAASRVLTTSDEVLQELLNLKR